MVRRGAPVTSPGRRLAATTVVLALLTGCTQTQDGDFSHHDPFRPALAADHDATARSLTRGLTGLPGQAVGQLQHASALRELAAREILLYQQRSTPVGQQTRDSARREINQPHGDPFARATMLTSLALLQPADTAQLDIEWFDQAALGAARTMLAPAQNSPGPGPVEWTTVLRLAEAAATTGRPATADHLRGLLHDTLAPRTDQVCRTHRPAPDRDTAGQQPSGHDAETLIQAAAVARLHRGTGLCASTPGADTDWLNGVAARYCTAMASGQMDLFNAIELAQAHRDLASEPTDRRCTDMLRTVLDDTLRSRQLMSDDNSVPLHGVLLAHRTLHAARMSPPPLPDAALARIQAAVALAGAPADSSQPVTLTEAVLGSVTSVWLNAGPAAVTPAQLRRHVTGLAATSGIDAALTRALAAVTETTRQDSGSHARQILTDPGQPAGARLAAHVETALLAVAGQRRCQDLDAEALKRAAGEAAGEIAQGSMLDTVQLSIWLTALAHHPATCLSLRGAADHAATVTTDALVPLGRNTTPEFTRIHDLFQQWRAAEKNCRPAPVTTAGTTAPAVPGFLAEPAATRAALAATANTLGLGPLTLTYLELRIQRLAQAGCGHSLLTWFTDNDDSP